MDKNRPMNLLAAAAAAAVLGLAACASQKAPATADVAVSHNAVERTRCRPARRPGAG
jgi:hypothetical protein